MKKNILYVGVDVDDKNFHVSSLCLETGEVFEFTTKPTFGALKKILSDLEKKGFKTKTCYEASYIGFSLCRELNKSKLGCEIVALSLIPTSSGKRVKTDKIDCRKLSEYYAKGLLTPIYIPDEKDEEVRNLIRTRSFLVKQRKSLKIYIISQCRLFNLNYITETNSKVYWTKSHLDWLKKKINNMSEIIKVLFTTLLIQFDKLNEAIESLDNKILELSQEETYKTKSDALNCFYGIDTLTSMVLISELGDIRRFSHPKKLTSYSGLDITEYSSGGKEKKYGITKMGNKQIRTVVAEACQRIKNGSQLSKRLKKNREKVKDKKIIDIADKCFIRLKKKSAKMYFAGKHNNKIKIACARELLNFVWEMLTHIS